MASSQPVSTSVLASPLLYLSSSQAGWEGLEARAFHEPEKLEGWITPAISGIALVLFHGGSMHLEQRHAYGPWKALPIHQGDLMLLTGESAPYESRWTSLSSTPTQTLHLHLKEDLFTRTAKEVAGCDPARLSLVERSGFHDPLLRQIGYALWQELEQSSPTGKLYAQTTAQLIAVHLLRHYTSAGEHFKEPSQGLTGQQMRRVLDCIQDRLGQDLSLETLAQQSGFSPYYFARMFRQTTGESPHQFVLRQRVERAQRLLRETDLPLAQIALESGFAHQSHLTRAFKQQFGLTPRLYRREYSIRAHS